MEILITVTNWMLARRWVQYALLAAVALLTLFVLTLTIGVKVQTSRLHTAQKKLDGITAQVELQNEGIRQLQAAGKVAEEKAQAARNEAARLARTYEAKVQEMLSHPAPADCEEARQYGFEMARKLAGGAQ